MTIVEGMTPAGMRSLGRVYHGSSHAFSILDPSRARSGLGAYVTPNREFAQEFGDHLISGELFASHYIDLHAYGAFVDEDDLDDIAHDINHDLDQLADCYKRMTRANGEVFMFNLLENCGFELQDGVVVGFQDWGAGSAEPAFVFGNPDQFVPD